MDSALIGFERVPMTELLCQSNVQTPSTSLTLMGRSIDQSSDLIEHCQKNERAGELRHFH